MSGEDETVRPATTPRAEVRNACFTALEHPSEALRLGVLMDGFMSRWPDLPAEALQDLASTVGAMAQPAPCWIERKTTT